MIYPAETGQEAVEPVTDSAPANPAGEAALAGPDAPALDKQY
jgi:hypothetical protein